MPSAAPASNIKKIVEGLGARLPIDPATMGSATQPSEFAFTPFAG